MLASLYLGSGYAVAAYYGYADVVSPSLLMAFGVFSARGDLALWLALHGRRRGMQRAEGRPVADDAGDARCRCFRRSSGWPSCKIPRARLSVGLALFPPASPFLMLMRMAMRPAPPVWQVALSIVL